MSGHQWVEEVRKAAVTVILGILAVLITSAFVGSSSAKNINAMIDARVDQRVDARIMESVAPKLDAINSKLDFLVMASYDSIVKSIDKQCDKLKNDPKDIKLVDIEQIMKDWMVLPTERKTDDLIAKYNKIKEWYINR